MALAVHGAVAATWITTSTPKRDSQFRSALSRACSPRSPAPSRSTQPPPTSETTRNQVLDLTRGDPEPRRRLSHREHTDSIVLRLSRFDCLGLWRAAASVNRRKVFSACSLIGRSRPLRKTTAVGATKLTLRMQPIWYHLRASRAHPPGLCAADESRRQIYVAAMEQFEELIEASDRVSAASRPLTIYYALAQAGKAIVAAHSPGDPPRRHGLTLPDPSTD